MHANIKLNSTKKNYAKILLLASVGLVLVFISSLSVSADTYESNNFQVLDPVIGAGAKRGTSDNYILWQSLGEIGLGKSTASNFKLNPGFLTWPISSPASNVSASAGNGQVTLSWTAGTAMLGWTVSGYTIGQSTVSGGPYTYSSKGKVPSATISSLTNGTTYYFVVINEDAFGNYIATSTEVSATPVAPTCGDGSCNGSETCSTCPADCGSCGGGGGGGGGGGYTPPSVETKVILQGKAYPNSLVTVLKDGKKATVRRVDSRANFEAEITDLTAGIYTFGVWAKDKNAIKSITYTLTFRVLANTTTTISGIFLPPTIDLDKISLQKGEILNIFGQTVPEVEVDVHIYSSEIIEQVQTDEIGAWFLAFDTQSLEEGLHITKARFNLSEEERSGFSRLLTFYVGEGSIPEELCLGSDLNKDGRVNLVDFSILLYWWGRSNVCVDQNRNGIVDLPDFSIMMYYWTG